MSAGPRPSAFKGKDEDLGEIGRKLDVGAVLEGSVRRDGNRVRITAQLVKAVERHPTSGRETFDRELTGVFAVQDEIARAVVEALRVKLMPGQRPLANGVPHGQPGGLPELSPRHATSTAACQATPQRGAIAALERAVELDPGLRTRMGGAGRRPWRVAGSSAQVPWADARRGGVAAANRAVELAPDLPEATRVAGRRPAGGVGLARGAQADVDRR